MIGKRKPKPNDYTKNMLPQTRRAVFFDVLQLQWKKLFLAGVLLLLFYIPILLIGIGKDILHTSLYISADGAEASVQQLMATGYIYTVLLHGVVLTLLMALFSVALSGVLRIVRQYAWEENVHFPTDFAKGIRDNYRKITAICMLAGLIYVLCLGVYYTVTAYKSTAVSYISLLPVGLSVLVVLPIFAIALVMVPIYNNRLGNTLKNAFVVYSRSLLKVVGFLFLCLLIWVPALIPNFYCHIFGGIAGAILTPYALLAWSLFCYNRFDEHINPAVSPELIGRGTFPS